MNVPQYPFEVRRLTQEEGGGFLITFPDLPGCMSDGDTVEEAVINGADAEAAWLKANEKWGGATPKPGKPARFIQRLPKNLHARLQSRARQEGVSLNTLVATFIAECLGRREVRERG